jgi:hypothetical protein
MAKQLPELQTSDDNPLVHEWDSSSSSPGPSPRRPASSRPRSRAAQAADGQQDGQDSDASSDTEVSCRNLAPGTGHLAGPCTGLCCSQEGWPVGSLRLARHTSCGSPAAQGASAGCLPAWQLRSRAAGQPVLRATRPSIGTPPTQQATGACAWSTLKPLPLPALAPRRMV